MAMAGTDPGGRDGDILKDVGIEKKTINRIGPLRFPQNSMFGS